MRTLSRGICVWLAVRCHSFYCRRSATKKVSMLFDNLCRQHVNTSFWGCPRCPLFSAYFSCRFFPRLVLQIGFRIVIDSLRWFWVMALATWVAWSLGIFTSRVFRCFHYFFLYFFVFLRVINQRYQNAMTKIQIDIRATHFTVFFRFQLFFHFRFQ